MRLAHRASPCSSRPGAVQINEPDPDPKRGTGAAPCHWQTLRAGWYYGLLAYMWSSAAKAAVHNKAALKLLRERC